MKHLQLLLACTAQHSSSNCRRLIKQLHGLAESPPAQIGRKGWDCFTQGVQSTDRRWTGCPANFISVVSQAPQQQNSTAAARDLCCWPKGADHVAHIDSRWSGCCANYLLLCRRRSQLRFAHGPAGLAVQTLCNQPAKHFKHDMPPCKTLTEQCSKIPHVCSTTLVNPGQRWSSSGQC